MDSEIVVGIVCFFSGFGFRQFIFVIQKAREERKNHHRVD